MEQKTAPVSKRKLWSVYVIIEREIQEGRILSRPTRLGGKQKVIKRVSSGIKAALYEFLYVSVTKMYKKDGILYIEIGTGKNKETHMHDMKRIISIQIREYKRSGVQ